MKSKKLMYWLDHGIFFGHTMFSVGYSYDEIMNHLKKKKAHEWIDALNNERVLFETSKCFAIKREIENIKTGKKISTSVIFFRELFTFSDEDYSKLAHEILHICQFCLTDFLDRNKEHEAEAYFHTHLMNQCLWVLRGCKKLN